MLHNELLLDDYEQQYPACFPDQADKLWGRVVGAQRYFSHLKLGFSANLVSQAEQLREMQTYVLTNSSNFPDEYTELISMHRFSLRELARALTQEVGYY